MLIPANRGMTFMDPTRLVFFVLFVLLAWFLLYGFVISCLHVKVGDGLNQRLGLAGKYGKYGNISNCMLHLVLSMFL